MQIPVQITFRGMEPSAAIEQRIRERATRLERYYSRIMGCRVVVEAPHRHHHQGIRFHVRIDLTVPQNELVVNREPAARQEYEDVYVAIRDAFNAAERQLYTHAQRHSGVVKTHEEPSIARVSRLFRDAGYGFITTGDGRDLYFHSNSVLEACFSKLQIGSEVWFAEELGEKGPQASTVRTRG